MHNYLVTPIHVAYIMACVDESSILGARIEHHTLVFAVLDLLEILR